MSFVQQRRKKGKSLESETTQPVLYSMSTSVYALEHKETWLIFEVYVDLSKQLTHTTHIMNNDNAEKISSA